MTTYKKIEASRNIRLWITQVVLPVTTLATTALIALPDTRKAICRNVGRIKDSIVRIRFKRKVQSDNRVIISIDAKNRHEAIGALDAMIKELLNENYEDFKPINKRVVKKI